MWLAVIAFALIMSFPVIAGDVFGSFLSDRGGGGDSWMEVLVGFAIVGLWVLWVNRKK
jgi:hypothetical protein